MCLILNPRAIAIVMTAVVIQSQVRDLIVRRLRRIAKRIRLRARVLRHKRKRVREITWCLLLSWIWTNLLLSKAIWQAISSLVCHLSIDLRPVCLQMKRWRLKIMRAKCKFTERVKTQIFIHHLKTLSKSLSLRINPSKVNLNQAIKLMTTARKTSSRTNLKFTMPPKIPLTMRALSNLRSKNHLTWETSPKTRVPNRSKWELPQTTSLKPAPRPTLKLNQQSSQTLSRAWNPTARWSTTPRRKWRSKNKRSSRRKRRPKKRSRRLNQGCPRRWRQSSQPSGWPSSGKCRRASAWWRTPCKTWTTRLRSRRWSTKWWGLEVRTTST